jgi:hypothetical protein
LLIQRKFRSWRARRRLGKALVQREMGYRMKNIQIMTSEEELCQEKLAKLASRLQKANLKGKAEQWMQKQLVLREKIRRKENDLIEIRRQLDMCTPRTKEKGWSAELEKNQTELRDQLTKMKVQYLFEVSLEVSRQDEALERAVKEMEELAIVRDRVQDWKEQVPLTPFPLTCFTHAVAFPTRNTRSDVISPTRMRSSSEGRSGVWQWRRSGGDGK